MTPPAEKGKGFLQGGVLDLEVVDFLLQGGKLRGVRGVAAGRAAVAESKKPIGGDSEVSRNIDKEIKRGF